MKNTRKITLFSIIALGIISLAPDFATISGPGAIDPYLNGIFPKSTPGPGGSWLLEDPMPGVNFSAPVRIIEFPETEDILVLIKQGEIWRVNLETAERKMILDFKDRAFKLGDGGAVGMVLHPKFGQVDAPEYQVIFVYYRTKPEPDRWDDKGYNRLSKFKWDEITQSFDLNSEEILIQQYDRSTWHDGGALFFGPDEFLYFSVGDEGADEMQSVSTQRLDGALFSGIFRIDVDNDPDRSHPIRRQPIPNATAPDGWWPTFTQGYSIPNDNPWVNPEGNNLEEYYALGARSPYAMNYDTTAGLIWMADVGGGQREEINQIQKGDNLQWPYLEGTFPIETHQKPANFIGNEKPVFFEYDRSIGACIIGGSLYQSNRYPKLEGKYLFADYISNRLMALDYQSGNEPVIETLINNLGGQGIEVPDGAGFTGVFPMSNGEILLTVIGDRQKEVPGKIYRLKRSQDIPDPPVKLSDLGVFTNMETLIPIPGIIPYKTNAPLWSDRADKKRWMAIPNDGVYDSPDEQILFNAEEDWQFPEGTVFIKHLIFH